MDNLIEFKFISKNYSYIYKDNLSWTEKNL